MPSYFLVVSLDSNGLMLNCHKLIIRKCELSKMYHDASTAAGHVAVSYSKFCDLWNQLYPFTVIMRQASDLCWTCEKNNNQILKSANLPETRKAKAVKQQETHLKIAAEERDFYKSYCKTTKDARIDHIKDVDFSGKRVQCRLQSRRNSSLLI